MIARRFVVLGLAFFAALVFAVRGYHDEREALHFRDFKQPYASARCLLTGCDPYSEADTRAAFLAAGGVDDDKVVFDPYSALYPPFSLAALVPVAALPYPAAHAVWEALVAVSFSAAVLLTADLCGGSVAAAFLLAAFAVSSTILLMLGQVSGLVIALLVIGFALVLKERLLPLAASCFLLAVLLKPHDAAIPLVYLLFGEPRWRRVFAAVLVSALVFAGGSLVWFAHAPATAHWIGELGANLHGNAAPGSVNDPGPGHTQGINLASLQALFAVVRDRPGFFNPAAFGLSALLLAAWAVLAAPLPNTRRKHLLAIAAIGCLALLPIYHRQYDTRMLLLAFPAVAHLLNRAGDRLWGAAGFALLTLATVFTSHQFLNRLMAHQTGAILRAGPARTLLLYRPLPELLLLLCIFFLAAMHRERVAAGRVW